ncbi:MAG: hypothetical protein WDA75_12725 [Candidatus Latescibacterota bacterium]|jgi:lysophospholipase L1-like esterase
MAEGFRHRWLHRVLAVGLGFGLLAVVELLARLVPGLELPPLVVTLTERPGQVLRSINPLYAGRFFFDRYQGRLIASGRMASRPFVEPRSPQVFRVLAVGESTVQGYPHPRRLAAASFLEAMLQDLLPHRRVEVINLGITSIASFAVGRVLEEAMVLDPDLVVVYTGHNEFYGIYGAASGTLLHRAHYAAMQWRLTRALQWVLDRFRSQEVTSAALLEVMAQRGEIPPGSPCRVAAAKGLGANLRQMVHRCQGRRVPIILCTLVANEAGFAPAAATEPPLEGEALAQWHAGVERAAALLGSDEPTREDAGAALASLDGLAASGIANSWYWHLRGRALARMGEGPEAAAAFRRALDLDAMPWRAPSAHNQVIREVAARTSTVLADVEAAFRAAAPADGIGWDLMVDHLHPSVRGQQLLARAVVAALPQALPGVELDLGRLRSEAAYEELLGNLPVEEVRVYRTMAKLLAEPPMNRYNAAGARLFARLAGVGWERLSEPERRGAAAWGQHPDEVPLVLEVADRLYAAQDLAAASRHYQASLREAPYTPRGDMWATVQWARSQELLGRSPAPEDQLELREALARLEFVAQTPGLDAAFVSFVRGALHRFLGEHPAALGQLAQAYGDPGFRRRFLSTVFPLLADELIRAGRLEEARRYAAVATAENAGNPYFGQLVEVLASGERPAGGW